MFGGVYGWVFGGVLGWVFREHPPFNFSLFIVVLSDMGGCWGVFAQNYIFSFLFLFPNFLYFCGIIPPYPSSDADADGMHLYIKAFT